MFIEEHAGRKCKVKSEIKTEVKLDKELRVVLKCEPLPRFKPKKGNKASTFSTASKLVARAKKKFKLRKKGNSKHRQSQL